VYLLACTYLQLPSSYSLPPTPFLLLPSSSSLPPTPFLLLPSSYSLPPTPFLLLPSSYSLIAAMDSAAIITPIFLWLYLLVALVLFVNLLIAMFNAEFTMMMEKADDNVRMAKSNQVEHYIRTYPVPPPFNVPAIFATAFCSLLRWMLHGASMHTARAMVKSWSAVLCHGKARQRGQPQQHYPTRLHLPDNEVEALLVQARDKFHDKRAFTAWRKEAGHAKRFDRLEKELREGIEKVIDEVSRRDYDGSSNAPSKQKELAAQQKAQAPPSASPLPVRPPPAAAAAPAAVAALAEVALTSAARGGADEVAGRTPVASEVSAPAAADAARTSAPPQPLPAAGHTSPRPPPNGHASHSAPPVLAQPVTRLEGRRETIRL
jgi:hypothetical protein